MNEMEAVEYTTPDQNLYIVANLTNAFLNDMKSRLDRLVLEAKRDNGSHRESEYLYNTKKKIAKMVLAAISDNL